MACRKIAVTEQTYYRWRKEYGGMGTEQLKRLKELEKENARMRRAVADLSLEKNYSCGGGKGKLLSPIRRRQYAEYVREQTGSSERKVYAVLGQHRTTQRYRSSVCEFSVLVRQAVINYASEYGRYGYRTMTDLLRTDWWGISYNRVERIWKQEGLKVPAKQRPRKRLWLNDGFLHSAQARMEKSRLGL